MTSQASLPETSQALSRNEALESERATAAPYWRIVLAGSFGNVIEWYDFFIYAILGPLVFDALFFPKLSPAVGMIAVFSTFAVGFLARPIGGIVFGHFGDRLGRKASLQRSLMLMGIATTLIGCLPSYEAIGILAPILLVVLRFLQGFALGGESIGSVLMALEGAPAAKRGFFASIIQASGKLGIVGATGVTALVSLLDRSAFMSWGWRIPFVISIILVAVGLYVRNQLPESAIFLREKNNQSVERMPIIVVLREWWRPTLVTTIICMAETAFFYLVSIFTIAYGTKALGIANGVLTTAFMWGSLLALLTVPWFGHLADRAGRRPVFAAGMVAAMVCIAVFFPIIESRDAIFVTLAVVVATGIIHPMMFGPEASFVGELFDTRVRFTGASTGKQIGTVLGGGLAPLIASSLLAWNKGSPTAVVIYFLGLGTAALLAMMFAAETRHRAL